MAQVPPSLLPDSFPLHNLLVEACRAAADEVKAAAVMAKIDELGLTNISPEATIRVDGEGQTPHMVHSHTVRLLSVHCRPRAPCVAQASP